MRFLLLLSMLLALSGARAHEGHDHGDAPAPVAGSAAPRFEARTETFELVGVLAGEDLVLYLDRADSNAPVDGAELEIESGSFKAQARRVDAGVYRIKAGPLAKAGKHALTLGATAGEESDLLTAAFDNSPATLTPTAAESRAWPWRWIAAGVLLLVAALALMIRRGRK